MMTGSLNKLFKLEMLNFRGIYEKGNLGVLNWKWKFLQNLHSVNIKLSINVTKGKGFVFKIQP